MESGIYVRIKNDSILLEDMTEEQRIGWLKTLNKDELIKTVNILSKCLKEYSDKDYSDYEDYLED